MMDFVWFMLLCGGATLLMFLCDFLITLPPKGEWDYIQETKRIVKERERQERRERAHRGNTAGR